MIEILKETARYLVCVKPAGTAAQGTQAEAMPQLLSAQLGCEIFPVHRLDQTVGGVMVYAKTAQEAAQRAGETVPAFVGRAIETQAQRDKVIQAMKPKEKAPDKSET